MCGAAQCTFLSYSGLCIRVYKLDLDCFHKDDVACFRLIENSKKSVIRAKPQKLDQNSPPYY